MRFNTGNAVGDDGSDDPRDLYDNSQIIDVWTTDRTKLSSPDRLGVPRKTWRGIEQQVTDYLIAQGYESIYLTYGAGVVVERQTQLVQRDGELYRVMNASDTPLTLTGTWATDAPKLQAVGDAALRQALANGTTALVDSAVVGYRGRHVNDRLDDTVYVTDDHGAPLGGAKGDGVTDDYAAIMAAFTFANLTGRKTIIFPKPTVSYAVGQMMQVPIVDNMRILGVGFPTIQYIGDSAVLAVVSLDQSISGGRYGIGFENFNIQGNAQVQEGLYTRAISHSTLRNVRSWDCVHSGIRINSGVCNTYDNIRATSVGGIVGAPGLAPAEGIVLDQQSVGDYVAWCTFINVISENVTGNGIRLNSATGNVFLGGTSEGNPRGIFINVGCDFNQFINIDYEDNGANSDVVINGRGNVFDNNQNLSSGSSFNYDVQDAEGTIFKGGNLRAVRLQASSNDTKFYGSRFSDDPGLGITGPGTYSSYGCVKEDNSGVISVAMPDKILRAGFGAAVGAANCSISAQGLGSTSASSCFRFLAGGSGTLLLEGRNDGVLFSPAIYALTTASPANCAIGSDGSFSRSTSALKYKDVKGPIPQDMIDQVMGLSGFMYQQKHGGDGARLFVGMAADDFDVDGLRPLISYGDDGDVEGLHYERLTVVLIEAVKQLSDRVRDLEKLI
ncbi:hypothetical protein PS662_04393 [Pseudomonas fluorescens]|uniref:Peptidase S74 domain-containing protein n=1 Tax=Pseudomonas fluorescens TaxID=294 RepID=A0A5E6VY36_PSEFL|nr:right-handed parallel beta-helix repeat-containing protein [Pseudomonas fluorescens]VVN21519.1 hypothetical protein PS662_04393 [Pseudomonas fluorescens]